MAKIIFEHGILNLDDSDAISIIQNSHNLSKENAEGYLNCFGFAKIQADLIPDPGFLYYEGNKEIKSDHTTKFLQKSCILVCQPKQL